MQWTDEQRDAIFTDDVGIIVPAAAGSGKTAVLIERIIRILADEKRGVTPDRLLAVTFTVDATANMKQKLTKEFEKKLEADPDNDWLKKQQSSLALAKIRTINAFCYDFVKEYFSLLDIRDDVTILEAEEEAVMLDTAISETLEEFYQSEPALMKTLNDALCQDNDKNLENHINTLNKVLCSVPFPERWTKRTTDDFYNGKAYENYISILFEQSLILLFGVRKTLEYLYYIINSFDGYDTLVAKIATDIDFVDSFIKEVDKKSIEGIRKVINEKSFADLRGVSSKGFDKNFGADSEIKKRAYEHFKNEREGCKKTIDKIITMLSRDEAKDKKKLEFVGLLFEGIAKLTHRAREKLFEMKLEKNAISFADVEDMTVRLLLRPTDNGYERTELANDIKAKQLYKIILIDEFQDVNDLQELIFKALSDTDDLDILGKNVFVVGDVKQAIYGFRQANPELFIDAISKSNDKKRADKLVNYRLSYNFRSRENVIDLVNYIFEKIMSPFVGNVDYNEQEKLNFGAKYRDAEIPTDIIYFESTSVSDDDDDDDDSVSINETYTDEHIAVANYISDMLSSGHPVKEDDKTERPCRASDFCVLVRNNAEQKRVAKALETVGLRSYSENTDGYLKSREILVMINLLRVIDCPLNDLAMLSVMLSPVFGFTPDDITQIRLLCDRDDSGVRKKLYQIMLAVSKGDDAHEKESKKIKIDDTALEQKCKDACTLLKKLRYFAASMPLEALIKKIYDETDFYSVASAFENSSQMRANLRLLIEYAAGYDSSGGGGLSGFIRYFEKIESRGSDFSQASVTTNEGDAVFIKTMHKSKGLEYPFIVLCGLNKKFNLKDASRNFICDRNFGTAIKYHNVYDLSCGSNISYDAMSAKIRQKLLSEEMRLLYVALTRAKERICIPVYLKQNTASLANDTYARIYKVLSKISNGGKVNDGIVAGCNSFIEWLMLAIGDNDAIKPIVDLVDSVNQVYFENSKSKKGEYKHLNMVYSYTPVKLNVYKGDVTVRNSAVRNYIPEPADEELTVKLSTNMLKAADEQKSSVISKLSVTEIVRNEQEKKEQNGAEVEQFYPRLPKLDEEIDDLTHAERGTFTHLFMELADYSKAEISVPDELERLKALKLFTKKEAEGVYIKAVEMFFAGDFYKRMKESKQILREKKFMARIDELDLGENFLDTKGTDAMVQGIADCIFEEDDGFVIVDYKTDRFRSIEEMDKYSTQLKIYKAAFDLLFEKPVKSCYIYSFWLGMGREIVF